MAASFSVAPSPTGAGSGTVSHSSSLPLPACLSQVYHKVLGHLLFLSLCYPCSFLSLESFHFFPFIVLHPSLASSLVSPSSLCPQLCHSLADLVTFLLPTSCFGNRLRYSRAVFWLEAVSSQASLSSWAPLCSFVHGVECHIRKSDFAHIVFPFVFLFPSPSFSCILHILCALEQCHSLHLITN